MPFDGNGNWTSNYYPQSGELIKASDFNGTFIADIANGFGNCVTRDGQGIMQTETNANNYRVINVADPVNNKDAVNLQTFKSVLPDLFDCKFVDYELDSEVWLKADNFSWHDGTVYTNAYNHLADDIENIEPQTETIEGHTITFYLADDGHKIVKDDQESVVQQIFADCGVAWYYILDTTNQRFKLPRTKYGFVGLRDTVGDYIQPSLPNIKGYGTAHQMGNFLGGTSSDGAIYTTSSGYQGTSDHSGNAVQINFDASRSSTIYKDGATVQPPATEMYLYFYVGQFTKTATEQTAGITTAQLNAKAENDLSNITNAGKFVISSNSAVDYSSMISVAAGVSSLSYTAPANGVVIATTSGGTNDATGTITVNGVEIPSSSQTNSGAYFISFTIPLAKNDVLVMSSINGHSNIALVVFIPCFGG